jgi:NADH-quinone oxidoreductase subunit G
VRFCRYVTNTREIGVFSRGEDARIELFPGAELNNPYSMNVADICPVGALTTRDFRFKIRVWFLDDVESVCNQCSNGCNIYASRSNNRVYRYIPRRNDAVNDSWMCDQGRLSYRTLGDGRLTAPKVSKRTTTYTAALRKAAEAVAAARGSGGRIVGVASAFASNEDLFTLREMLSALGADAGSFSVPRGEADDFLLKAEKAPNASGARALGFRESDEPLGSANLAIVLGHAMGVDGFTAVDKLILLDTHESVLEDRADVVLPTRSFAEGEGTFTNHANRVQRFLPILEPTFEVRARGVQAPVGDGPGLQRSSPGQPR